MIGTDQADNKFVTAYVCTVVFGVNGAFDMVRLLPAETDQEAIDMAKRHLNALMLNGFKPYGFEVTREVHTLDKKRGITTEKVLLSRDGAVNGVSP